MNGAPEESIAIVATNLTIDRLVHVIRGVSSSLNVSPQLSIVTNDPIRPQSFDITSTISIHPATIQHLRNALLHADPYARFYVPD